MEDATLFPLAAAVVVVVPFRGVVFEATEEAEEKQQFPLLSPKRL